MPLAERETRRQALAARLHGIDMTGVNEPSNALVDRVAAMYEANVLRYIPWETCTSKSQEVQADPKDKSVIEFATDNQGFLKKSVSTVPGMTEVHDALLLRYALTRRGLACELGGIMSYETHEVLVKCLFKAYHRPPPDEGYRPVTLNQMRRADQAVFLELADQTRMGIRIKPDGKRPIDELMVSCTKTFEIVALLTNQPAKGPGGPRKRDDSPPRDQDTSNKRQRPGRSARLQATIAKLQADLREAKSANTQSATKGGYRSDNPKGKGRGSGPVMPKGLIGKARTTEDGRPICFNFNLDGCPNAQRGDRCPRGYHVCAEPGCEGNHPIQEHAQKRGRGSDK